MNITTSKINFWEQKIKQEVSNMPFNKHTIDSFLEFKKGRYDIAQWEEALWNNTEEQFIKKFLLNEALRDLNDVQQIARETPLHFWPK
jgi:hypothetical protein